MRCHEARKFLGAYLDSELDARTSQEIELHLESCPECARYFEAEERLEARIANALTRGERTAGMWHAMESRIATARRPVPPRRWARVAVVMTTGLVVAIAGLWEAWPWQRPLDLALAATTHHQAYVDEAMLPAFTGLPSPEAANQLEPEMFALAPASESFLYLGGRACKLHGVPVAWIFGRSGESPVSVIVLRREELSHFPAAQKRLGAGDGVVCARAGRYQMAARCLGRYTVCVISELSLREVEELARAIPGRA
jgi:anti-sigma factor RsiW